MRIAEFLNRTGKRVITIRREDTVETASTLLANNNIGALPVRDEDGGLVGVISERDIVRGFAASGSRIHNLKVADLMSPKVITCAPDDEVNQAMVLMSRHHIRHLPVVEDGNMLGIISSRDVMAVVIEDMKLEREVLRDMAIVRG